MSANRTAEPDTIYPGADDDGENTLTTAPRCIAAVRVDGGTTFAMHATQADIAPAVWSWMERVRRPRDAYQRKKDRKEGWFESFPMPAGFFGFESAPVGNVTVDGTDHERITWHAADRSWVQISQRFDQNTGEFTWYVRIQCKAPELYADGLSLWCGRWLGLFSWGFDGGCEDWRESPWSTTQLHLNSDFEDLEFVADDAAQFVGPRKGSMVGRVDKYVAHLWASTIYMGSPRSDVELVIYRKTQQLEESKKIRAEASIYYPLWEAGGYQGGPITRVEFRLRKKGLYWKASDSSEADLRCPSVLVDDDTLPRMWSRLTGYRRLVLGQTTRRSRDKTDPRWEYVQAASSTPAPDLRQVRERVRELSERERYAKYMAELLGAGAKLRGHACDTTENARTMKRSAMMVAAYTAREHAAEVIADPERFGDLVDAVLPSDLHSSLVGKHERAREFREFFAEHVIDDDDE